LPSRVLNSIAEVGLFGLAAVIVVAAVGPLAGWWHYEVVESGSMTPAMRIGGVAVVEAEPLGAVRVGQILAFHPPGEKYVRIHRVIALTNRGNQVWIRTKGDANNVADPGPIRLEGKTAYTEHFFVPYVGYGAVWLHKHSTRLALEGALLVLGVGGGLFLIWGKKDEEEGQEVAAVTPEATPLRGAEPVDEPTRARRPLPRRSPKPNLDLSAEKAAAASATAAMLALGQIYTAKPEGGAQGASTPGPPTSDKARALR
jgi:signal peptidase I